MKIPGLIWILLFTFFGFFLEGHAQCCSAGNPYFYGEQANVERRELQVIFGYKYGLSDQYYHNDSKVEIDFVDKAYFNYLNLQMIYGLSKRVSLQGELGYFLNRTEEYKRVDWNTITGYGIGDAALTIKYLAYKNFIRKISLIPSLGVKIPVGVFDQEMDHVKLPITVQPSSGSFKYLVNLYLNKSFRNSKFNLSVFGLAEFPMLIDSENFYYRYGNLYLLSIVGSYYLSDRITLGAELRGENRNRSTRENAQTVESSGYKIVYAIPHISFSFAGRWFVGVNADVPVYRYYNGIQLANEIALSARLSCRINFEKRPFKKIDLKV